MAKQQRLRVVIDTNWYVSASINRKSRRTLYALLADKRLQILYADRLFEEFSEVIYRPKFEKTITSDQIQRFIRLIVPILEHIKLKTPFLVSRDPKDNYLLSLSSDGNAHYLVTGDPDLLVIDRFGETEIITMAVFQQILVDIES
ncbi:MAG: putative toxin-antitoxin system toxin component, PIN family [Saprospiraceae bacterium]